MSSQFDQHRSKEGILAWFAHNQVAANLLMIAVVLTGLLVAGSIRQEVYPTYSLDEVEISVDYRGASPEEVEHSVIVPIESELRGMDIIRQVRANASEGNGTVTVELVPGTDRNRGLQEVTAAVQQISIFPDEAELPEIALETGRRRSVMSISVYGDLSELALVEFGRQLEEGLLAEPEISLVAFRGMRRPEIHVEIPQAKLRSLNLRLSDVAQAIDESALDVPAGSIRTPGGEIRLKTTERRHLAEEFKNIAVINTPDGAKVLLSDIARVYDGFEESEREVYFNDHRTLYLSVYSTETQSPLTVAKAVRRFIQREKPSFPPSVGFTVTWDRSDDYKERLQLLLINGSIGLILVLLALAFFLELRVAFWTAAGIPVSILGSFILLPAMDASINMISLFGFIVTLGIVVDDAVVVGEDIFHKMSEGMGRLEASIAGVKQMSVPVIFAVSTNIIAFLPLIFVPGETGRFFHVLPAVVIAVFTVSLIECLLILPAHLAFHHEKPWFKITDRFTQWQTRLRIKLDNAIDRIYSPIIRNAINYRGLTVSIFLAGLVLTVAYVWSGRINFAFRPTIQTDFVQAEIKMPTGTPVARTREVAMQIQASAKRALELTGESNIVRGFFVEVADHSSADAEVSVFMVPQSQRIISSEEFANLWRDQVGEIPDLDSLFFDYLIGPGGSAEIDIQIAHPDVQTLRQAATELAAAIERFPGVEDVRKGFGQAMPQMNFEITPDGRSLGVTARELGRQIRHSFYGAEALRQPRNRDELRVMVKLPVEDRRSMSGLEDLLIRVPGGGEIPLHQAAKIISTEAPVRIERVDGGRIVNVTANIIPGVTSGNKVLKAFLENDMPDLQSKFPGLRYSLEGEQREKREAMSNLSWGLVSALFAIYAIMASLLRSYTQAFIVLLMIPWSLAGAVIGHVLMGFDLSVFSVFGMIALCGMVVNGAFVMTLTRQDYQARGHSHLEATILAAQRRFRPIFLTAITTFLGLGPMIFETSMQALFLVPMAIALGMGTLVSAVVVLTFIPAVMVMFEEFRPQTNISESMPAQLPLSKNLEEIHR